MKTILANSRPAEVLLVEDNDNDVELTRIGFKRSKFAVNLHHVWHGEECMAFLRKEAPYSNVPTPDLILLDLNLPRMDGRAVLNEINNDDSLKHLPVVILTTSEAHQDVVRGYQLHCNSYIVKPIDFDNFTQVVQGISNYWFTLVVLPSEADDDRRD